MVEFNKQVETIATSLLFLLITISLIYYESLFLDQDDSTRDKYSSSIDYSKKYISIEPRNAIFTMLISTDDINYIAGSVKLARSIRKNVRLGNNIDMVLLELIEKPLPPKVKHDLEKAGWSIRSVHRISPRDEENTFPRFRDQFTKLQLWNMTEYDRIVYLDSDTLVVDDISDLFLLPFNTSIVASRDVADGRWRGTFNMGMFMIKPNNYEYHRLLYDKDNVKFETAMSEQGFLNVVYKNKWKDPGFIYNANLAVYSQLPRYWREYEEKIRVIHYTMEKPWKCSRKYQKVCSIWEKY